MSGQRNVIETHLIEAHTDDHGRAPWRPCLRRRTIDGCLS